MTGRRRFRKAWAVIAAIVLAAGTVLIPMAAMAKWEECGTCGGTGKVNCNRCGGSGKIQEIKTSTIADPILGTIVIYTPVDVTCPLCHGGKTSICLTCGGKGGWDDGTGPEEPEEPEEPDDSVLEKQKDQIPDVWLRAWLAEKYDKDGDNFLNEEERNSVTYIDVAETPVASMQGILLFPNLESLYLDKCRLTALDVGGLQKLGILWCAENQLTELKASDNPELFYLKCEGNHLETLNVTKLAKLRYLMCDKNQLTELDLSGNPGLAGLHCNGNKLQKLNLTPVPKLVHLECSKNGLTELDLSGNPEVYDLICSGNKLTKLDVTVLPGLQTLDFMDNEIEEIDVSRNPRLQKFIAHVNRLLCVDVSAGNEGSYEFGAGNNSREVEFKDGSFDMGTVPGFDMSRASDWQGGKVNGTVVTLNEGAEQITYVYQCGKNFQATFTLKPKPQAVPGDVNGDGEADGRDAVHLMRWLAEETDEETGERIAIDEKNADLNGDGAVDEKDLLRLVKNLGGEE